MASLAGTSRATVSYVLNRTPGVTISEATTQRVLAAASQLGYVPSFAARSLAAGHSDAVLLVLPDAPLSSFIVRLIHSLQRAFREAGLLLTVYFSGSDDVTAEELAMATIARTLLSVHPLSAHDEQAYRRLGLEVISPNAEDPAGRFELLREVLVAAGRAQANHLIAQGHRRLAYVGHDDPRREPFSIPRREGVTDSCLAAGLSRPEIATITDADLLGRLDAHQVSGICAYSDDVALALRRLLADHGRLDDYALIGGNDQRYTPLVAPLLPSIAIDTDALARQAVERVQHQVTSITADSLVSVVRG